MYQDIRCIQEYILPSSSIDIERHAKWFQPFPIQLRLTTRWTWVLTQTSTDAYERKIERKRPMVVLGWRKQIKKARENNSSFKRDLYTTNLLCACTHECARESCERANERFRDTLSLKHGVKCARSNLAVQTIKKIFPLHRKRCISKVKKRVWAGLCARVLSCARMWLMWVIW